VDDNKRIAAAAAETFLEVNGARLVMTNFEVVELFLNIAASHLSRDEVDEIFRANVSY
jgi:prophage maintenance system killer protein